MNSFRNRIILNFGLVFFAIFLSTAFSIAMFSKIERISNRISSLRMPTSNLSQEIETGIQGSLAGLRGWLLLRSEEFRQERMRNWEIIDSNMEAMGEISVNWTNPENKTRLRQIKPLIDSFRVYQLQVESASATNQQEANQILASKAAPTAQAILDILREMVEDQKNLARNDIDLLNVEVSDASFLLIAFSIAALAVFLFLAVLISRSIVIPLHNAVLSANKISELDLDSQISLKGPEEVEELGESLENMRSHLKNYQEELSLSYEELSQFSYRTSHDLKAPLITVRGLSNVISEDIEDGNYEEARANANKIADNVGRLEQLVVDILNLAKADLEETKSEHLVLRSVVESLNRSLDKISTDFRVKIENTVDRDIEVFGSRVRLTQVLENITSNAIKYSDPKKDERYVRISSQRLGDRVEIKVEDNGLGIPKEFQAKVFKMFQRFHPDVADGSGLGMHIVKKHVTKMNGVVGFESSDSGTIFRIDLPAKG